MTPRAIFASDPALSRGRQHVEVLGETRGPRTTFQRDRDRIIHSISFRRLRHKTQVFLAPDGDHYRVRLTHSLEVAQIARTMARALGLDEDLTEALALAHDIGHPPFGHAGEDALTAAMAAHGGFDHNGHTLRAVMLIDSPYPRWQGLNLSWETLEGLAKHNGPVSAPGWALAAADAAFPLALNSHAALEAQVAAIADDIAYDNHDIDDGLRAGLIDRDDLLALPFVARHWDAVRRRYPDVAAARLLPELVRHQIGAMVNDVLVTSRARIAASGITTSDDARAAGQTLIGFSDAMQADERALKIFMYAKLYHHPRQLAVAAQAHSIIAGLYAAYADDPRALPDGWRDAAMAAGDGDARAHQIGDYIAGMTDRYAIARYREHVGPVDMGDVF
jgi:dGTPase